MTKDSEDNFKDQSGTTNQGATSNQTVFQPEMSSQLQAISLKLAPFWPNSPVTWFIQAEAQFAISRVSLDSSKYYHVLASLSQDIIESILDFVQDPPVNNMYPSIKKLLIDRHSQSEGQRIERLLSSEQLGDRKPSDFYRSLKLLAGTSGTIGENLIKSLWLRRLPQAMNIALISLSDKSMSEIISIADKIHEATQLSQVGAVASTSSVSSDFKSKIEQEILELKSMIQDLSVDSFRVGSRSRQPSFTSRNRSKSESRSNNREIPRTCWYHSRFGAKATKCLGNCDFKHKSSSSQQKN